MLLAQNLLGPAKTDMEAVAQAGRSWAWLIFLNLTTYTPDDNYSIFDTMLQSQFEPADVQAQLSSAIAQELRLAFLSGGSCCKPRSKLPAVAAADLRLAAEAKMDCSPPDMNYVYQDQEYPDGIPVGIIIPLPWLCTFHQQLQESLDSDKARLLGCA